METVEDFVVRVAANPVLVVNESRMDVLTLDKLGKESMLVLQHDRTETLQLGFLLTVYIYLVIVFQPGPDVGKQEFEILVENRLR